jgi:hypothetical protein
MHSFTSKIYKIGVNPYVLLPKGILDKLFSDAGKSKGPIPVKGKLNGNSYLQTLVKYSGKWRLYLNGPMLKSAFLGVGDMANIEIEFDPELRTISMHPKLKLALTKNKKAATVFEQLPPYRKKEIVRYVSFLKTDASVIRNVDKIILHLLGKEKFAGRDGK